MGTYQEQSITCFVEHLDKIYHKRVSLSKINFIDSLNPCKTEKQERIKQNQSRSHQEAKCESVVARMI